jgi:hypothetical protein
VSSAGAVARLDRGDLPIEKLDVAQTAGDRLRLLDRQPRALTPNRSEKGVLPLRQLIKAAWISFLALPHR